MKTLSSSRLENERKKEEKNLMFISGSLLESRNVAFEEGVKLLLDKGQKRAESKIQKYLALQWLWLNKFNGIGRRLFHLGLKMFLVNKNQRKQIGTIT